MSGFSDEPKPPNARAARNAHSWVAAPHGTMRRYWAGCVCELCRAEHRRYVNARNDEIRRGIYQPRPRAKRNRVARGTTLAELLEEW